MSTLKVTHLQNENGTGPAMSIAVGGGVTFAGITTFHDAIEVGTGATQLRITSAGNVGINDTDPNFKLDVNGDIGIREGNNLVWHDASGAAAFRIRAQSDNILRFERASGNEPNLTIDDGKIGIGDTQPERKLDVVDSGSSGAVVRSKVTTNNGGYLAYEALNSSGTSVFSVTHNGRINLSENIVFASGQGLDFSATADGSGTSSSELLDDYEEGTWTPKVKFGGVDATHVTQIGSYVKIGRLVVCYGMLALSATGTGGMSVEDLPFQVADILSATALEGGGIFSYQNNVSGVYGPIVILPAQNSFAASVYAATSTSGSMNPVTNNNISSNFDCRFTFSYQTAT